MDTRTQPPSYLSAAQAAEQLQIRLQTLYSYASRGLLTAVTEAGGKRSLYDAAEVARLAQRKRRSAPKRAAIEPASTPLPPWGRSGVTTMGPQGPHYRGRPFQELATHPGRFENVAEMLWSGLLLDAPMSWDVDIRAQELQRVLAELPESPPHLAFMRAFSAIGLVLGGSALEELREGSTTVMARRLILAFAASLAALAQPARPLQSPQSGQCVAEVVLRALGLKVSERGLHAVNALLITCADHELSTSTLAVRVAASTGAGLNACLAAGLHTHSGSWLGGSVDRIEDLLAQLPARPGSGSFRLQALDARLLAGSQAYPFRDGDPRARFLFEVAQDTHPQAFESFMHRLGSLDAVSRTHPGLPVGVLGVGAALQLPRRAASALSVIGRCAGWCAHVMEQRLSAEPIRPCWPIP